MSATLDADEDSLAIEFRSIDLENGPIVYFKIFELPKKQSNLRKRNQVSSRNFLQKIVALC